TRGRVTDTGLVALVAGAAHDGLVAHADARLARIAARTGIPVVAGSAIGRRRTAADARRRIADSRLVTLVTGAAHDRLVARATARLAGIAARTRVPVVAGRAVRFRRTAADARRRIADARLVALVTGAAHDRLVSRANTRLARIDLRAGIPV